MDTFRVIITPRAADDLADIHEYISKDSEQNAAAMISRILDALELLGDMPHRTIVHPQSPKSKCPVRSIPVRPYIVYFRVIDSERVVQVIHVRHGARERPARFD